MFNINTDRLIEMLLSPRLLTASILAVLKSILEPIKTLVSKINTFRDDTTGKLSFNGQVCSLERLLNLKFPDPAGDRIFITDAANIPMLVAYPYQDANHLIIVTSEANFSNYPVIAYCRDQIGDNSNKFIINIPDSNEAINNETQLIALVNRYRFAGKSFILRYI
jgi:hypothetical protein